MINGKVRLNKVATKQYLALYLMLLLNQSNFYRYLLMPYRIVLLIVLFALTILTVGIKKIPNLFYMAYLAMSVVLIRFLNGGIGVETYADYVIPLLIVTIAMYLDRNNFLQRFVKLTVFLCIVSLIGCVVTLVAPGAFRLLPFSFESNWATYSWTSATEYVANYYKGYGMFLVSWIDKGMSGEIRNIGIFTEPGIYQMVINSALFVLLFMDTGIPEKKKNMYLVIFVATLITCRSTSGFLGMAAILLVYIGVKDTISRKVRKRVYGLVLIAAIVLIGDAAVNGETSIINSVVINKLVTDDGAFSLAASSSGAARLGTIAICIMIMFQNPLGVGLRSAEIIKQESSSNVAGALMSFGATMGVIPFVVTLYWLFNPVFRWKRGVALKLLIVFLYLNTALAQSSAFYPALILIPMYLRMISARTKI